MALVVRQTADHRALTPRRANKHEYSVVSAAGGHNSEDICSVAMTPHSFGVSPLTQANSSKNPAQQVALNGASSHECRMRNDRQSYFKVVRDLAHAQFDLADGELTARLWQDVAERDLDRGRIIHLLFQCGDQHDDDAVMRFRDEAYLAMVDPNDP